MLSTRAEGGVPPREPPWTRSDTLLVVSVMLLAASLDFYGLGAEALWHDEALTFHRAALPLPALAADAILHFHVPTYFALIHCVLLLGDTEWWLRMPSAVFAVLAVGACFFYGRLVSDRFTGGVAAALMALSRFQLHYAQEARMYSLLAFVTTLTSIGVVWLVKHPELAALPFVRRGTTTRFAVTPAWRHWLLCVFGLLASLFVHNMAAMSAMALALVALGSLLTEPRYRVALLRNWCLAGVLVAAVYARWIFIVFGQISRSSSQPWGQAVMRDLLGHVAGMFAVPLDTPVRIWLPVLGATLVAVAVIESALKGRGRLALALLGLAVLPLLSAHLVGSVRTAFSPRTLIGATSSGHVLMALGVSYLVRPLAGFVVLALAGLSLRGIAEDHRELTKDGWRDLMPLVEQHVSSTTLVVCGGRGVFGAYNYYVTRRNSPYKAPPCSLLLPAELEERSKRARDVMLIKLTTRRRDSAEAIQTLEKLQWERVQAFKARRLLAIQYRPPKSG